ncbi:hypothetical protein FKM82_015470 [Ascaphus truei]
MDRLYASLKEELRVFEEQVQKCRMNFDLQTLQRVLALLSEGHGAEIDSWQQIEHLAQTGTPSGDQWPQLCAYLSWLLSYVGYLRAMKDAFDDHVVFPLCDHLYMNDEEQTLPVPGLQFSLSPPNITVTARLLFHHRRSWALLLSMRSQGQNQHVHGASHSTLLLHRIPDIFQQSLVTANLARHWILLHEARPKNILPSSQDIPGVHFSRELQTGIHRGWELWEASQPSAKGAPEIQAQLRDMREQMMFLLWRVGRAEALELQVKEANHRVLRLQQDLNEVVQFTQRKGRGTSGAQEEPGPEAREKLENLERQLNLEKFHQGILHSDWLLELDVRPSLIRQIDTVQDRCAQLETSEKPRKETHQESPKDSISDTDWDSSSVFSQTSTHMSDVFTHR